MKNDGSVVSFLTRLKPQFKPRVVFSRQDGPRFMR
jgi:hypothetical protein